MDSMLVRLFKHLEWADRALLASFEQAGEPPPEALKLLAHLLAAEHIWLARLQAEGPPAHPVWPALTFPECRALADRNRQGFRALLGSLEADRLDAPVAYRDSKGNPFSTPLSDLLLHVAPPRRPPPRPDRHPAAGRRPAAGEHRLRPVRPEPPALNQPACTAADRGWWRAVLPRTISSGCTRMLTGTSPLSMVPTSRCRQRRPTSAKSWRTVVRGGVK